MTTPYQELIHKTHYSRFLPSEGRRETWEETVSRYYKFFGPRVPSGGSPQMVDDFKSAVRAIRDLEVMPSMRALWSAGPALDNDNIAGYNCAAVAIDHPKAFAEILYILMNGAGAGFSVERQFVSKLPEVPRFHHQAGTDFVKIVFEDSKLGWAEGFLHSLEAYYAGRYPVPDLSKIRPKGSPLKTFGGRASGPEPLQQLLDFTHRAFSNAEGRKLTSIECHDICCMIANCVVAGGTRRSATISLSNLSDLRMRGAKDGEFWLAHPHRSLSNNSVAYTEKPDMAQFMDEWTSLMKSGNGERGIFNREGMQKLAAKLGRDPEADYMTNPCGEVILKPQQFCNLTEVVVRPDDTLESLKRKVKYATILGVLQSTLTDFKFLRPEWKKNVEEERLLGVSLTGVADHPILNGTGMFAGEYQTGVASGWLKLMKKVSRETADEWADALGINRPKALTCVKPSGTVSQLVDSSSGLHPRWSEYFIRRVRMSTSDPLCALLRDSGVPSHPEVGQEEANASTSVFDFPMKSPYEAMLRHDQTAIEQLSLWLNYKRNWCDHNPSVTIYVAEDEWLEVGAWVYKNWDNVGGLAFLPKDGGIYPLAPYEEIDADTYTRLAGAHPDIDFSKLPLYEKGEDKTTGARELACQGGACEL